MQRKAGAKAKPPAATWRFSPFRPGMRRTRTQLDCAEALLQFTRQLQRLLISLPGSTCRGRPATSPAPIHAECKTPDSRGHSQCIPEDTTAPAGFSGPRTKHRSVPWFKCCAWMECIEWDTTINDGLHQARSPLSNQPLAKNGSFKPNKALAHILRTLAAIKNGAINRLDGCEIQTIRRSNPVFSRRTVQSQITCPSCST